MSEENKTIADFMCDGIFTHNDETLYQFKKHPCSYIEGIYTASDEDLFYHTRWDWLIPVVERIEAMGYTVKIYDNYCSIFDGEDNQFEEFNAPTKLEATYQAVLEFINEYKKEK